MTTRRRVLIAVLATTGVLVPLGIIAAARIPFSSETLRLRLINALEERLDVDADLDSLTLRFHPSLRAVGTGLTLRSREQPDVPPLIEVRTFTVDANLRGLWNRRVSFVKLDGLRIQIPPDDNVERGDTPGPQPPVEPASPDYLKQVVISDVDAPDAKLVVLRRDPSKPPRTWSLHQLHVRQVSFASRMPFETVLTNAIPPGEIKATGTFGPWATEDPGRTPLDGAFNFDHADLSVFDGIAGILSAAGNFRGTLNRIDINGQTDTPDFTVNTGGHPVQLKTSYHALVDATNGNTTLDPVDATFLNTSVKARGGVYEEPSRKGRVIKLDLSIDGGRLEDIMRLAVRAPRAPMSGLLRLTTKFVIPPEKRDVVDKLQLDGHFTIQRGRFTDADVQKKVNELSRRASARTTEEPDAGNVGSNFDGRFTLNNGRLALPTVTFDVPGALVELHGQYGMKREDIAFDGNLYMDAKISQTVTGFKSLLLKAVDPLFRRKGKTVVPLKISGSRAAPKFGVDVGRVIRRSSADPYRPGPSPLLPAVPAVMARLNSRGVAFGLRYPAPREGTVNDDERISRRRFAELGATAATGLGLAGLAGLTLDAQQGRGGAPGATPQPTPRPEALKSEFLMDMVLETAPAVAIGSRTVVGVTGGTFEGPKLKGKVVGPGADWPLRISDTLRILDVRTILVTDDDQKIYMTYRGVIRTPAPGQQGERYWRTTPIFETDSKKYEWITQIVAVGVSYTVPQRVAYRIFEIV